MQIPKLEANDTGSAAQCGTFFVLLFFGEDKDGELHTIHLTNSYLIFLDFLVCLTTFERYYCISSTRDDVDVVTWQLRKSEVRRFNGLNAVNR